MHLCSFLCNSGITESRDDDNNKPIHVRRASDEQRQRRCHTCESERHQDACDSISVLCFLLGVEPDVLPDVPPTLPARRLHQRLLQLHRHHGFPQLLRQPGYILHQIRPGAVHAVILIIGLVVTSA